MAEYLRSNVTLLRWMIAEGYGDVRTLERRVRQMEEWLENPTLMSADSNAEYAAVIEIDLAILKSLSFAALMIQMTPSFYLKWLAIRSMKSLSVHV